MSNTEMDPFESGGTSAKFIRFGHGYAGTIQSWSQQQQTDKDTDAPLFWDEAKLRPKLQVLVVIELDEGDPNWGRTWEWNGKSWDKVDLPEDDGFRTLWVKGGLWTAWVAAMRKAKVKTKDLPGWHVDRAEYTEDGTPEKKGNNPPKRFAVELSPGKGSDPFDE